MDIKSRLLWLFVYLLFTGAVRAEYLEVTLLGTGSPQPDINRFGPATVIEARGRYFIFDAGRGITMRLQQAGIPLSQIEHVFITHLHSDHITGFSDLWLTSWVWQRSNKLNLYGPKGIEKFAQNIQLAYAEDLNFRIENTQLNRQTSKISTQEILTDGVVYEQNGIRITAFAVDHGVVKPAYGYRLDAGDRSVVISGDTSYSENLIKHAKGADVLIHEIAAADEHLLKQNNRLQKVMSYHSTPEQVAKVFNQVQPRAAVLTHILLFGIEEATVLKKTRALYPEPIYMGEDLLKIGVSDDISVTPSSLFK